MKKLITILFLFSKAFAGTYYVSTTGSDAAAGGIKHALGYMVKRIYHPCRWGYTLHKRWNIYPTVATVIGGDNHSVAINTHSGTAGNLITVLNYPGEIPILNGSLTTTNPSGYTSSACIYLQSCDYWYIKGLTFTASLAYGLYIIDGNNNTVEMCVAHHNYGTGFIIQQSSENNLFKNCDAYANADYPGGTGDNSDGFEISFIPYRATARINTMRGCRTWNNSDDGTDNYHNSGMLIYDSCWSWANGYAYRTTTHLGDGNGFKIGPTYDADTTNTKTQFLRQLTNCLSFDNYFDGIEQNDLNAKVYVYNCTSWNNGQNGIKLSDHNLGHIVRNNVAWGNAAGDFYGTHTNATVSNNSYDASWQSGGPVANSSDFLSIDTTGVSGARQANGTLPVVYFMRLTSSSDLIDVGTNVGIGYTGSNPDLGAFEYDATLPPPSPNVPFRILIKRKVRTQ